MCSATPSSAAITTGPSDVKDRARQRRRHRRGVTTLMYAAQQGDVESVKNLVRMQPSLIFDYDRTGKTALHYCSTSDSIRAAQAADILVMAAPELVESRDEDGFTPLHLAVIAGNVQLVTFLLANNADVNALDNEKHTVVHWATVCGETAALRAVLAAGAPVSTPDLHGGYPLHYAAQMCGGVSNEKDNLGMQVLQALLTQRDIDVSVTDDDKRQPLLWAASAGSAKALLALIRAGAAVEAPDKDGLTALHCAASRGHTDCIDTLLTLCGASPDIIDSNGCTALHYAVTLGHADATALLLAHGADPNRQDRKGRSPAHCGCAKGQFETVKLIGAHGANLWLRNARGDLPLHEAAASGRRELVNWLLNMRPSQVNARNNDGRCPLHMAALNDNADMCKILLDSGAFVNPILRTSKNVFMTPLDCALQKGFRSTAKFLQLHGGVPANRIGDPGTQKLETTSALSFQIRDDVTFWGGTSSDSDKDIAEIEKAHRKIKRRKLLAQRKVRKKKSLSESDMENEGLNKSPKRAQSSERQRSKESNKAKENVMQKATESLKSPLSSRLEYSNEIIINGKTEINIHQTKEISIEREGTASRVEVQEKISLPASGNLLQTSLDKDKRPKSAKYSKLKEKSAKYSAKASISVESDDGKQVNDQKQSSVKIDTETTKNVDQTSGPSLRNQSTNTSEETAETVIDTYKALGVNDTTHSINKQVDGQSLRSNTSEDTEQQKDIIVEAAVHAEPKNLEENQKPTSEIAIHPNGDKSPQAEPKQTQIISKEGQKEEQAKSPVKETQEGKRDIQQETSKEKPSNEDKPLSNSEHIKATTSKLDCGDSQKDNLVNNQNIVNENESSSTLAVQEGNDTASEEYTVKEKTDITKTAIETAEMAEENANSGEPTTKNKSSGETKLPVESKKTSTKNEEDVPEEKKAELVFHDSLEDDDTVTQDDSEAIASKSVSQDQDITLVEKYASEKRSDRPDAEIEGKSTESSKVKQLSDSTKKSKTKKVNRQLAKTDGGNEETSTQLNQRKPKLTRQDKKNQQKMEEATSEALPQKPQDNGSTKSRQKGTHVSLQNNKKNNLNDEGDVYSSAEEDHLRLESSKPHKSFKVLEQEQARELRKPKQITKRRIRRSKSPPQIDSRSKSEETRTKTKEKLSKIPTPLFKTPLSKSDRHLDKPFTVIQSNFKSNLDAGVLSLPNIYSGKDKLTEPPRSESNMSAPLMPSVYSDNELGSGSDLEEDTKSSGLRRKRFKKRQKSRGSHSAGSDYESSNLIDSGFEPSPRSTRIPKWRNMSERGVNMTSVTQTIQSNIRRYHLERKIFQHLLELKRSQIRAGKHNEAVLVKRAIDQYHQSCASTVGAGRYIPQDYSFKSFEKFLYESLRRLQRNDAAYLKGLPETCENVNPLLCTQSTHRCMHATHAYTGIPCAAYLPMMDHHTIPKIGFNSVPCKPGTGGFLPNINQKKAVTLELSHGTDKQVISLPTDKLDQNKRYYVTFTVKGRDQTPSSEENAANDTNAHRHSKSD